MQELIYLHPPADHHQWQGEFGDWLSHCFAQQEQSSPTDSALKSMLNDQMFGCRAIIKLHDKHDQRTALRKCSDILLIGIFNCEYFTEHQIDRDNLEQFDLRKIEIPDAQPESITLQFIAEQSKQPTADYTA